VRTFYSWFLVETPWFRTSLFSNWEEEFGSYWLRPSSTLKVSRLRVKVCIESVGICKGLRGAGFDAIRITRWEAVPAKDVAIRVSTELFPRPSATRQ